tara:strand:- start:31071 stop:31661 length:591 start_codon:yes stop_codon:yes gene_type:complete
MAEHKNLTGTNLHEPKGVAESSINKVYVSDGLGSGAWEKIMGWEQYVDNRITDGTPAMALTSGVRTQFLCNGSTSIVSRPPSDAINPLWNVSTNLHKPIAAFDTYHLRFAFTASSYSGTSPYIDIELDIGGGIGTILSHTHTLIRSGAEQAGVINFSVYSGSTYLANGGGVFFTYSGTGTCNIHSTSVKVERISRN